MGDELNTAAGLFEGHADRECGEHRTTGLRAWCFGCSEWCYPQQPCKGCELPILRAEPEALRAEIPKALYLTPLGEVMGRGVLAEEVPAIGGILREAQDGAQP